MYGGTRASAIQCWPSADELRAKSEETLSTLRIKKVEWNHRRCIFTIRFTLTDGTQKQIGTEKALTDSFSFPDDRPIKTIEIRAGKQWVYALNFLDAQNNPILEIDGHQYGQWFTEEVEDGEQFIGIQETHNHSQLCAIGFQTMKQKY